MHHDLGARASFGLAEILRANNGVSGNSCQCCNFATLILCFASNRCWTFNYVKVTFTLLVQLPLQQLAWLLQDRPCRLIICGMGTAGAVAQHAALSMQRLLQSPISDEAGQSQMLVNCTFLSGIAGLR